MNQYNYFTKEGNKFHLNPKWPAAAARTLVCLAIAAGVYIIIPPEKRLGVWGAGIFVLFALVNLLKSTKKLTINTSTRTIAHKQNALSPEETYHFDQFDRFYIFSTSYIFKFILTDCTAFIIFSKDGREKRVPVVVGFFSARPAENAVNELSDIMGVQFIKK